MFDQIPLILAQPGTTADAPPSTKDKAAAPATKDGAATTGTPGTPTTGAPGTPGAPIPRPPSLFGDSAFLFILMGGLVLMIIFSMRTQRKERKKREDLMSSLKKGDRIQTIGGLLGTVVEVREDRVIIKADENNNTKLTFVRSAIQAVIADNGGAKPEPEVKKEG